jgi:hypothetical protein
MAAPFLLGAMCLLVLAGCGGSNNNTATGTTTTAVNNTANVVSNFGPNGSTNGIVDGIFTNVTVCQHGTTTCVTVDNVLVDTGSIGLRLVQGVLGSVTLSQILNNGSPLLECIQYGDTSFSWGPMVLADVQIAGEQASNIPIQLLGATNDAVPQSCLAMTPTGVPNGGNEDTLATLGANGILGIAGNNGTGDGEGIFDCGNFCTTNLSGNPYYTCPNTNCSPTLVTTGVQAANVVAAFSSTDKNGFVITFPSVPPTGATTLSGTINFGIGTKTDNALSSNVTVYALDPCGDLPSLTFNGINYTDTSCSGTGNSFGGFLDTGSNALFILDANTLSSFGILDCSNSSSLYCVSAGGTAALPSISVLGNGAGSGTILLNIADANRLFTTNNAVFNDLGGDSVTINPGPLTDFFDFGAPFFFGHTVYVGIGGEAMPTGVLASTGFVAF